MTLNDLRDKIHEMSRSKGWWPTSREPKFLAHLIPEKLMLTVSELSEALEYYRENGFDGTNEIEYGEDGDDYKPVGIAIELADAIIRILDLCGALGIDIHAALVEKMKYNSTRPHRHGGKRA